MGIDRLEEARMWLTKDGWWLIEIKDLEIMTQGRTAAEAGYMMIDAIKVYMTKDNDFLSMDVYMHHMEIEAKKGTLYIGIDNEKAWDKFAEKRGRKLKPNTQEGDLGVQDKL